MQAPLAGSPPMAPYMGYQGFHPGPRQAAYGGMVRTPPLLRLVGFNQTLHTCGMARSWTLLWSVRVSPMLAVHR